MAKGKGKGIGGIIGGALGAAALNALVPAIEPTINKVVDKVAEEFEKQNDLISVPDTYAKEMCIRDSWHPQSGRRLLTGAYLAPRTKQKTTLHKEKHYDQTIYSDHGRHRA